MYETRAISIRVFPGLLLAAAVAAAAAAAEPQKAIKLMNPGQVLSAADPEGQGHAAVKRGDYRLIWVAEFASTEPVGVYCSTPMAGPALALGNLLLSDFPSENSPPSAFAFATKYNQAIANDPAYPFRDICRPGLASKLRQPPQWNGHGRLRPVYRFYANVRPEEMPGRDQVQSLHRAARLGLADRVRDLIPVQSDINATDEFGMAALTWAIARDHEPIVDLRLENGASVWPRPPPLAPGETWWSNSRWLNASLSQPLTFAVARGRIAILRRLLVGNRRELAGRPLSAEQQSVIDSCLNTAVEQGNLAMAKLLVESGARVSLYRAGIRSSTIALAMKQDRLDLVEYLLPLAPKDANATPLHVAAALGRPTIIKYLLERGADANARNRLGETPLFAAVVSTDRDKLQKIDLLLAARADPNARAGWQQTPLMYFGWLDNLEQNRQSAEVARRLYTAGADLNLRDEHGGTALTWALWGGTGGRGMQDFDLAYALIDLGTDVNVVEGDRTALDYAKLIPERVYGNKVRRLLAALAKAGARTAAEIAAQGPQPSSQQPQ